MLILMTQRLTSKQACMARTTTKQQFHRGTNRREFRTRKENQIIRSARTTVAMACSVVESQIKSNPGTQFYVRISEIERECTEMINECL